MASQQQHTMPFGYSIEHMPDQGNETASAPQPTGSPLLNDSDSNLLANFWDSNDPYSDNGLYNNEAYDFLDTEQLNASTFPFAQDHTDFSFVPPSFMYDQTQPPQSAPSKQAAVRAQPQSNPFAPYHFANDQSLALQPTKQDPQEPQDGILDDSQFGANALLNLAANAARQPSYTEGMRPVSSANGMNYPNSSMSASMGLAPFSHRSPTGGILYTQATNSNGHRPGQPLPFGTDQSFQESIRRAHVTPSITDGLPYTGDGFDMIQFPEGSRPSTAYTTTNGLTTETAQKAPASQPDSAGIEQLPVLQQPTPEDTASSATTAKPAKSVRKRSKAASKAVRKAASTPTIETNLSPATSAVHSIDSPVALSPGINSPATTGKAQGPARKRRKSSNATGTARPRLTEEQKKERHIHSEQKRRDQIKDRFADLHTLVPKLTQGGFSKAAVLQETVRWLEELVDGNRRLEEVIEAE